MEKSRFGDSSRENKHFDMLVMALTAAGILATGVLAISSSPLGVFGGGVAMA
jgi:hypothetical protein